MPPGHRRFIASVVEQVKGRSRGVLAMRKRSTFEPPDADLNPDMLGAMEIIVFAPHMSDGTPKPPCPWCGWDGDVVSDGWSNPGRRVFGLIKDKWLMGPTLKCKKCEATAKRRRDRAPEDKRADRATCVFMHRRNQSLGRDVAAATSRGRRGGVATPR